MRLRATSEICVIHSHIKSPLYNYYLLGRLIVLKRLKPTLSSPKLKKHGKIFRHDFLLIASARLGFYDRDAV